MRNTISVDDFLFELVSYSEYRCNGTNRDERSKMRKILDEAMESELTESQRYCITEYYLGGRKMKDIAVSLSVHPSTVTYHIKSARRKLRHIAGYYRIH